MIKCIRNFEAFSLAHSLLLNSVGIALALTLLLSSTSLVAILRRNSTNANVATEQHFVSSQTP